MRRCRRTTAFPERYPVSGSRYPERNLYVYIYLYSERPERTEAYLNFNVTKGKSKTGK